MCKPDKCVCGLEQAIIDDLDNWDYAPVVETWEVQDRNMVERSVDRMTGTFDAK